MATKKVVSRKGKSGRPRLLDREGVRELKNQVIPILGTFGVSPYTLLAVLTGRGAYRNIN